MKPDKHAGLPVARYLRPEEAAVPFRRRPELEELLRWCTLTGHTAVQLVTGDGGAGKTRLALRLGDELAANGWQPLWVPRGSERDAVGAVHTVGQPCVLVVDYAETRSELAGMLDDVAADQDGPDLRAVLLARSAGEWWQQLLASAERPTVALLEAHAPVTLGPVRAAGGPQELFGEAVAAFAQKMGQVGRMQGSSYLTQIRSYSWCTRLPCWPWSTTLLESGRRIRPFRARRCWRPCCGMRPGTGRVRRLAGAWTWM